MTKQIILILSVLLLLSGCGGDGKSGAQSNDNLLSDDYTFIDPIYPIVPPDPSPKPDPDPSPQPDPQPGPSNTQPVANAGDDIVLNVSSIVTLNGSGSYDADGDGLTYQWTLLKKPQTSQAQLSQSTSVQPKLHIDKDGYYTVKLIVYDGKKYSEPDFVLIRLDTPLPSNTPPVAVAGKSQTVVVHRGQDNSVILDGSKSYDDGLISPLDYTWSAGKYSISQPVVQAKPSCNDDWQRCYNADQRPICSSDITLTVFDGEFSDSDSVNITVDYSECEQPPIKEISSIHLDPAYQQTIPVTKHKTYKVWVYYQDSTTEDVTADAKLSTSNTSIATISNAGVVSAIAPGSVIIKASYQDFKDTAPLTVTQ